MELGDALSVRDSTVLVIGGGFSGVGAASRLASAGVDVLVVEQGRGLGGRVTTRHTRGSNLSFDHGCQYSAPKAGTRFHALCTELEAEGCLARWGSGRLGTLASDASCALQNDTFRPWAADKVAWVGVPGQSSLGRAVLGRAGASRVALNTRCAPGSLRRADDGGWIVETHPKASPEERRQTRHRFVLACGSASSTYNVVHPVAPELALEASRVGANPCWALMAAFSRPLFPQPRSWDGVLVEGSPELAWLACNSSKPGREAEGGVETWVAHATPGFSTGTDIPAAGGGGGEAAAEVMLAALYRAAGVTDAPPPCVYKEAFRWNAAFPLSVAPQRCFVDAAQGLGMCGDWCVGPRMGDAFESGEAAAEAVLAALRG